MVWYGSSWCMKMQLVIHHDRLFMFVSCPTVPVLEVPGIIAHSASTLTVVGDDAQGIYGFRGARNKKPKH